MNRLLYRHACMLAVFFCFFCCSEYSEGGVGSDSADGVGSDSACKSDPLFFFEPKTGVKDTIKVRFSIHNSDSPRVNSLKFFQEKQHHVVVLANGLDERKHEVTGEYDSASKKLIIKHTTEGRLDDRCEFTVSLGDKTSKPKRVDFLSPNIEQHIHIEKPNDSDCKKRHTITETIIFTDISLPEVLCNGSAQLLTIKFILSPELIDKRAVDLYKFQDKANRIAIKSSETYQGFCRLWQMRSEEDVDRIVVVVPSQASFLGKNIHGINPIYIKASEFEGFTDTVWNDVIFKVYAEGKSLFFQVFHPKLPDSVVLMAAASKLIDDNEYLPFLFFDNEVDRTKMEATPSKWELSFEEKENARYEDCHMYIALSRRAIESVRKRTGHEVSFSGSPPAELYSFNAAESMEDCRFKVATFYNIWKKEFHVYIVGLLGNFICQDKGSLVINNKCNQRSRKSKLFEFKKLAVDTKNKLLSRKKTSQVICIDENKNYAFKLVNISMQPQIFRFPEGSKGFTFDYTLESLTAWKIINAGAAAAKQVHVILRENCSAQVEDKTIKYGPGGLEIMWNGSATKDYSVSARSAKTESTDSAGDLTIPRCVSGRNFLQLSGEHVIVSIVEKDDEGSVPADTQIGMIGWKPDETPMH